MMGVKKVRDALVHAEFYALRVDQDHADLFGRGLEEDGHMIIALMATDLPEPVEPAMRTWGMAARSLR